MRIFIKSLGSSYVSQIKWRSMWTFVVQRLKSHNIVYGESIQHVTEQGKWGPPVHLHTMVKLLPEVHIKCDWDDSPANRRRREFCDKYEGYSHVCSCKCFLNEHFFFRVTLPRLMQGFHLRPEAGRFVRSFAIPRPVL